jgi:hypothetical protein
MTRLPRTARVPLLAVGSAAAAVLALSGCGSSPGPATPTIEPARTFQLDGFQPAAAIRAGRPARLSFTIRQPSGLPLTAFRRGPGPHTGVHVIVVKDDLSQIVHRHPPVAADGRIAETLTLAAPGRYRVVVDVYPAAGSQRNFQLFHTLTVAGTASRRPLPAFRPTVRVAGYTFTLHGRPRLRAISPAFLTVTVTRPDGSAAPFSPWYGALAHAIFFRSGSLDYFHTHVCGAGAAGCTSTLGATRVTGSATAPGRLRVGVLVPVSGTWRLFLQCRVDGHVLTAPFTLRVT